MPIEIDSTDSTSKVATLDEILCKISSDISSSEKELKDRFIQCALDFSGYSLSGNDLELQAFDVMSGTEVTVLKNLFGSSILRFFTTENETWVMRDPWRRRVCEFLKNQFDHKALTGQKQRSKKIHSHEFIAYVTTHITETEQKYINLLESSNTIEQIRENRTNLMRIINSETGKILLQPFLPKETSSMLGLIYKLMDEYERNKSGLRVVKSYQNFIEELNNCLHTFLNYRTFYADLLTKNLIEKIHVIINEDFSNNKATQPSKVIVTTGEKKYPLHNSGKTFSIGFSVKNTGPGFSHDTKLDLLEDESEIILNSHSIEIGRLEPKSEYLVEINVQVLKPSQSVTLLGELSWMDYDGLEHSEDIEIELVAQKNDVDWEELSRQEAYSLEPVENLNDLIGRQDLMNRLLGTALNSNIGSVIINGQKRVGKTSIAKTLSSQLKQEKYLIIYIEGGEYVDPSPQKTLSQLGEKICKEIQWYEPRVKNIEIPTFNDSLSPLADFLVQVIRQIDDIRILIILDEFDELPLELYLRGALGDAFFLTLRSICNRPNVGFVLVGSEKMSQILDYQGEKLNKWKVYSVDYFTTESDWTDYKELIEHPVNQTLEYSESAIKSMYHLTAGNPYFTKLICQNVFSAAIRQRDSHITHSEVKLAGLLTSKEIDKNTFQHFWDDGIFYSGEKATEKSVNRRRILLTIADLQQKGEKTGKDDIANHPFSKHILSTETELDEFIGRKILNKVSGEYSFKVPFFRDWIKQRGIQELIATFSDPDFSLIEKQKEIDLQVKAREIVDLVSNWVMYKGQSITEDKVRAWLDQFGLIEDQRIMFNLLCGLRFYSNEYVREKLVEAYGIVRREFVSYIEKGRTKRSDILISYLDSPAKSGSHFAKLFADEAKIYVENVVEKNRIISEIEKNTSIKGVVFLDDFVGTGNSASEYLTELGEEIGPSLKEKELEIFFIAVVAYIDGWKKLEKTVEKLNFNINLHYCELLDESSKCFSDNSEIYTDANGRYKAKQIAYHWGSRLEKKCPLGYGELEMALVFERSCPNNTLPILWSESSSMQWRPLFKRK